MKVVRTDRVHTEIPVQLNILCVQYKSVSVTTAHLTFSSHKMMLHLIMTVPQSRVHA